ncbi:bile acid:sodium symporter family protein [Psychrobacter sp. HD31]|uniref:bile acid:sodium symporter family protein n=1 Tax=Psychrobacter sp. HD31 TaxID=3112003 RepID=UPI003DA44D37
MFQLLPLFLAYIMFALGLQLKFNDFAPVVTMPKALLIGLFNQLVLVPVVAFALVSLFNPPPEVGFGVMLLSFCAGGITSNLMSYYAGGRVALSIVLTAIASMLAMVTVPLLVQYFYPMFFESLPQNFAVGILAVRVLLITTIPVILGMVLNQLLPNFVAKWQGKLQKIATILFAIMVIGAVVNSWDMLQKQLVHIGGLVLIMALVLLFVSFSFAKLMGLDFANQKTIAIETSLQNGAMGIALAPLIAGVTGGLPAFAIPSAIYGVLMNAVVLPFVFYHYYKLAKTSTVRDVH